MSTSTHFSYDDTLEGRLALAAVAGGSTALKDYIACPILRGFAQAGLLTGGLVAAGYFNAVAEEAQSTNNTEASTDTSATNTETSTTTKTVELDTKKTFAAFGIGLAALLAGLKLNSWIDSKIAGKFAAKGVKRPYTLLGAIEAVISVGVLELTERAERAQRQAQRS